MRVARRFASDDVDVTLLCCHYPEDAKMIPLNFSVTPKLDRSVLDLGSFSYPRKLPLLRDILQRLYEATDADVLIYSNVDIGLQPSFYSSVARLLAAGHDGFAVNRRTIFGHYNEPKDLPLAFAEAGEPHPGHDCFVFVRDLYPNFNVGNVCLGAAWVGRVLLWNLCVHAKHFYEFKKLHLTFHIGNDKAWKADHLSDYELHNRKEAAGVLQTLNDRFGPFGADHPIFPYLSPWPENQQSEQRTAPTESLNPNCQTNLLGQIFGRGKRRGC
jgi:hypothetical protein